MEDTCDEDRNEVTVLIISYNLIKLASEKNVSQVVGERHKKHNS